MEDGRKKFTEGNNHSVMESEKIHVQPKEEPEAPEGGWSWLIVAAIAMNKMAFWGALPCFGIVFADVLSTKPGQEGASIASTIGAFSISLDITSIFSPALYKKFSYRQTGTAGGVLYLAGSLAAAFSETVTHMVLSYGILQGLGFGLMISSSLAAFNEHFRRRRTVAMAVAQCAVGAGTMALPLAAQAVQDAAGFRAARLIFTGISVGTAASQLMLHSPPAPEKASAESPVAQQLLAVQGNEETDASDKQQHSLNGLTANGYKDSKSAPGGRCGAGLRRLWELSGMNTRAVRQPLVVLVAAGVSLTHLQEASLFAMLPLHLRALGLQEVDIAHVVTVATAGDFAGRIVMLGVGRWLSSRNRLVFAVAVSFAAVAVLALSLTTSWVLMLVLAALLGVCKGGLYVTVFLSIAEIVEPAEFPSAVALHFFLQMLFSFTVSPIIGAVRDNTGSFPVCFRVIAGFLALCPVSWGIDAIWRKRARQQRRAAEDAETSQHPDCGLSI